jgi:hypothetical protein
MNSLQTLAYQMETSLFLDGVQPRVAVVLAALATSTETFTIDDRTPTSDEFAAAAQLIETGYAVRMAYAPLPAFETLESDVQERWGQLAMRCYGNSLVFPIEMAGSLYLEFDGDESEVFPSYGREVAPRHPNVEFWTVGKLPAHRAREMTNQEPELYPLPVSATVSSFNQPQVQPLQARIWRMSLCYYQKQLLSSRTLDRLQWAQGGSTDEQSHLALKAEFCFLVEHYGSDGDPGYYSWSLDGYYVMTEQQLALYLKRVTHEDQRTQPWYLKMAAQASDNI